LNTQTIAELDVFLFDGDGVLYKEDTALPGSKELLSFLQKEKKQIFILTNNSTKQRSEYIKKLSNLGLDIRIDNILTSAYLTAKVIAERDPKATIYVIGEQGLKDELTAQGLQVANNWEEKNNEEPFNFDFESIDYVVTGMDRQLTYVKLTRAMNILQDKEVKFIGTNADITFPTPKGFTPGGGAMINILQELSDRQINQIIGKPQPLMFNMALDIAGTTPNRAIMFGDRIETDIVGAKKVGINTCLVLTGASRLKDIEGIEDKYKPDILANNLLDIYKSLSEKNK